MDPGTAHSLFQALRGDRSTFVYSGEFRDEHTARLIALGEASLDGANARTSTKGRLAFVMVEAYQNIIRHKAPLPPQLEHGQGRSLFILRCGDQGQHVVAMNAVVKSELPALRSTLDSLKGLSAEELKSMFLAGLQKPENTARRGAGLGLIEMTRRSGSDLGYMHRGLGPDHELVILAVRLGDAQPYDGILSMGAALHGVVVQHKVLLVHTGEPSAGVEEALLRIMEEDAGVGSSRGAQRGRAFLAGRGLLQAAGARGRWICAMSMVDGHDSLLMGRLLSTEKARELTAGIQEVNGLDRSEKERRYRNALLKRGAETMTADVYELARLSLEPIEMATYPDGDDMLAMVRVIF
jgi:hypothetical protein